MSEHAVERAAGSAGLPVFAFPEDAVRAVANAAGYGEWLRQAPPPQAVLAGVERERAAAVLARAVAGGPERLPSAELAELLSCWGIPLVESRTAATPAQAGQAAADLGGPVALKALGRRIPHKSDAGAVALNLDAAWKVTAEAAAMAERLGAAGTPAEGFLVQRMVTGAVEMLIGVVDDPSFGPVVAIGATGGGAELERDVAVTLAPVSREAAGRALRRLRTFPLLDGYRGAPRAHVAALEDVLVRVAALADAHPEVRELDLDPVAVTPEGAFVLDARARVAPAPEPSPWPAIGAMPPLRG
jgi:acyl-CoA synthetase (NDP forming)